MPHIDLILHNFSFISGFIRFPSIKFKIHLGESSDIDSMVFRKFHRRMIIERLLAGSKWRKLSLNALDENWSVDLNENKRIFSKRISFFFSQFSVCCVVITETAKRSHIIFIIMQHLPIYVVIVVVGALLVQCEAKREYKQHLKVKRYRFVATLYSALAVYIHCTIVTVLMHENSSRKLD